MRTPTSAIPGSFLPLNVLLVAFTRPEGNQSRKHTNRSMPSEPPTAAVHPGFRTTMGYTLHCLRVAQTPSCVGSETLWTAARQVLLSMGFSKKSILEWAVMPSYRESYQPRD